MMDAKLKPCPFCGGKAWVDVWKDKEFLACYHERNCVIRMQNAGETSIRKMVNAWNRRKDGDGE